MALLLGWMEVYPPTSEIRISLLAPLGPLSHHREILRPEGLSECKCTDSLEFPVLAPRVDTCISDDDINYWKHP